MGGDDERDADLRSQHAAVLLHQFMTGAPTDELPERYRTALGAVLAENARMREELEQLHEAQPSLQGGAFRIGWQTCRDKVNRTTEALRGELAALDYAEEVRKLNAEPSSDPELFDQECNCDCQPGQPCLCPERDCYCGPCAVCGETPQQRDTADGDAE